LFLENAQGLVNKPALLSSTIKSSSNRFMIALCQHKTVSAQIGTFG
jgi:hypothetical protein